MLKFRKYSSPFVHLVPMEDSSFDTLGLLSRDLARLHDMAKVSLNPMISQNPKARDFNRSSSKGS